MVELTRMKNVTNALNRFYEYTQQFLVKNANKFIKIVEYELKVKGVANKETLQEALELKNSLAEAAVIGEYIQLMKRKLYL